MHDLFQSHVVYDCSIRISLKCRATSFPCSPYLCDICLKQIYITMAMHKE